MKYRTRVIIKQTTQASILSLAVDYCPKSKTRAALQGLPRFSWTNVDVVSMLKSD